MKRQYSKRKQLDREVVIIGRPDFNTLKPADKAFFAYVLLRHIIDKANEKKDFVEKMKIGVDNFKTR